MKLHLSLSSPPGNILALLDLQLQFSQACNVLAPQVAQSRVWNRVALHHLHYRSLREQFPALGSQMVCNVVYAMARTARQVYQNPASPIAAELRSDRPLPPIVFMPHSPVYFDRHTLSWRESRLSLFTAQGRMVWQLPQAGALWPKFARMRCREIVLMGSPEQGYALDFDLVDAQDAQIQTPPLSQDWKPDHVFLELSQ
ncbi:MAG: hypothetical protein ACOYB1_10745 [Limnohabitans sp.]